MLGSEKRPTLVDLIRSMRSHGYSQEEIHDVVTGAGAPGEEVWILMDRIESDFETSRYETRISRISGEMQSIFKDQLEELRLDLRSNLRNLDQGMRDLRHEQCILEDFLLDLLNICSESFSEHGD
ncbi:MAG: hypothetical protein ACOCSH_01215 [Candidatus Hadarchaeota archaeon]